MKIKLSLMILICGITSLMRGMDNISIITGDGKTFTYKTPADIAVVKLNKTITDLNDLKALNAQSDNNSVSNAQPIELPGISEKQWSLIMSASHMLNYIAHLEGPAKAAIYQQFLESLKLERKDLYALINNANFLNNEVLLIEALRRWITMAHHLEVFIQQDKNYTLTAHVKDKLHELLKEHLKTYFNTHEIQLDKIQSGSFKKAIATTDQGMNALCYSPDGRLIASASWDDALYNHAIHIWDAVSGELLHTLIHDKATSKSDGHFAIEAVSWHPDGRCIATATNEGTIKIWDAREGVLVDSFRSHAHSITSICYSPDGTQIAATGQLNTRIWDVASKTPVVTLHNAKGRDFFGFVLCWSCDGTKIALVDFDDLYLYDTKEGKCLHVLPHGVPHYNYTTALCWCRANNRIVSSSTDGIIRIWDTEQGKLLQSIFCEYAGSMPSLSVSPDGAHVVVMGNGIIFIVDTNKCISLPFSIVPQASGTKSKVCWSPHDNHIALAIDGKISVFPEPYSLKRLLDHCSQDQLSLLLVMYCHNKFNKSTLDLDQHKHLLQLFREFKSADQAMLKAVFPIKHTTSYEALSNYKNQLKDKAIAGLKSLLDDNNN